MSALIGNFTSAGSTTHKEVALLTDPATGSSSAATRWNAPTNLDASATTCSQKDTWARGVDWDPTGTYFDIAASGAGGFNAYPALCDAFSRFKDDGSANATPVLYNATAVDSIFTACDVGPYVYLAGHFKSLNHEVGVGGVVVPARGRAKQAHYGMGVIVTDLRSPNAGFAVPDWNASSATGRGAGWASCLGLSGPAGTGGGVYVGGDAENVNGDARIERLAYFPAEG